MIVLIYKITINYDIFYAPKTNLILIFSKPKGLDPKINFHNIFRAQELTFNFLTFTGPKAGTSETWAENLPGEADHLIRSEDKTRETYWMPIVNARNVSNPSLLDWMSDKPQVRKEILDHYQYIGNSVEQIGQKWKNERLERLGFTMKTGLQFYQQNVGNNYGMILEMDKDGRILGSIHSVDGTNSFISEAIEGKEIIKQIV